MPSSAATKPRTGKQPPAAAAQLFWQSAQQLADAAERVADAPPDALVEGGLKSRAQDVGLRGLPAELDHLSPTLAVAVSSAVFFGFLFLSVRRLRRMDVP